jgi:hypothetical protein
VFSKSGHLNFLSALGLKRIAGLDAFYFEWSGLVHGLKLLQVNIQVSPTEYLQFSLTAQNDKFENIRDEFWQIISTFKAF